MDFVRASGDRPQRGWDMEMTGLGGFWRRAGMALGAAIILIAAAPQGGARLAALALLQPGQWELRDLDNREAAPRMMCVSDPNALIQMRHQGAPCSRLVIANEQAGATVHYTCPAGGFGRTSLRVETPRLATIDSQGIAENAPFAFRYEARRVGACRRG